MDVKEIIINIIISIGIGVALGNLAVFSADYRRKSILIGELNRQLFSLHREYGKRQQNLEENLGELGKLSENAIASLEGAGAIVERTGSELQSAAADLRSAKTILKNIAIQIRDLQSELDNCRADLYRIRDLAGADPGREVKPP